MEDSYLIDIIESLLKANSIYVKKREIYKALLSNPYYPSLVSISATLTCFGLNNETFFSDINHIENYTNILIHSKEQEGHFYVLKEIDRNKDKVVLYDGKKKILNINDFNTLWDGVVLITIPPTHNNLFREINSRVIIANIIIAICVLSCILIPNILSSTVILDIIAVIFIAMLKDQQVLEYKEYPFCKIGKRVDCKYVSSIASLGKYRMWT